jgi:high-affinity iron transporter
MQLVDYVGADYADAVADGRVINADEYQEMLDFSSGIRALVTSLPDEEARDQLLRHADELIAQVDNKVSPEEISALISEMRQFIVQNYGGIVLPRSPPDLDRGATLYAEQCASCHGATGNGLGPLVPNLDPAPVSFLDPIRASQRSLYGLYNTITLGVTETSMRAYPELTSEDRWSLAFFVGQLASDRTQPAEVDVLLNTASLKPLLDLRTFVTTTPLETLDDYGPAGQQLMDTLRTQPEHLFSRQSPLAVSEQHLDAALTAYTDGDAQRAYQLAVAAYLDGFELIEQGLDVVDSALRSDIERAMTDLRNRIRQGVSPSDLQTDVTAIKQQLGLARERLERDRLSGVAAFTGAFFILVREGLEALLVVAAFAAFLVKTEHRNNLRYLHIGWIGALIAGGLTWWASASVIDISGASRETTEGLAALFATGVLFSVGFWLHNKSSSDRWQQFIQAQIQSNLNQGTLWGLAGLSFVAVYREVFETILFYQALWAQTYAASRTFILSGFACGVAALLIVGVMVLRASIRLPLRQFFGATSVLMVVLAVIFAGKGVVALQEAGYLPMTRIAFPELTLLGIYPYLEGLLLQLGLVLLGVFLWFGLPRRRTGVGEAE